MNVTMEKAALIELLGKQIVRAEKEDARALKVHQAAEQAALKKFHDRCRDGLKWDYKTAKSSVYNYIRLDSPSCPSSEAKSLKQALSMVNFSSNQKFSFNDASDLGKAILWAPASVRDKDNLCDK